METETHSAASDGTIACDAPRPYLVVLFDRSRPLSSSSRHALHGLDCVRIGRGPIRGVRRGIDGERPTMRLTLPDDRTSPAHATLERSGDRWTLIDAGSQNGSFVDRRRVDRVALRDGDVIELGRTLLRFRSAVRTPGDAPLDVDASELRDLPARCCTHHPWFVRDLDVVSQIAASDLSVLLLGETGTGKEILARAIHDASGRPGPFVSVNCGALPRTLVEAFLFGHVEGAFPGADRDEPGLVRAANGGTLFLDEIGDLTHEAQAAVLRVIQERAVMPMGATRPVHVDLRIVSSTHRPLEVRMRAGAFREDLFARLADYVYQVPPLRDRIDDVGILLAAILRKIGGAESDRLSLGAEAAYALAQHRWPLNVRELEQHLKAGAVLAVDGRIALANLVSRDTFVSSAVSSRPPPRSRPPSRHDEALYAELLARLAEHRGNVTRAGVAMGKARTQVQRWVRRFGIDLRQFRD